MNDPDLMDAIVKGFADVQASMSSLREEIHFLDRKLDNRFDLLERMMQEHRSQDRNEVRELATRVASLEQTS